VGKFPIDRKGNFKHKVVPPHKVASAGDTLVFKYDGDISALKIEGDVFADIHPDPDHNEVRATLKKKDKLDHRIYDYKVTCDGTEADGESPPIVIIDP
jgi:hypothetical protein